MVALVDEYAGLVLDAIDRLGIREETAIIWHSDHGDQAGQHGMMLKFNMREGSVRVPLLISAPGVSPGRCDLPVEAIDLFPTICEILGVEVPDTVQGRSLAPLLRSETPADWRRFCFSQIGDVEMIRSADWKLNLYGGEPGELYHLTEDPTEFFNLIDRPEARDRREELLTELSRWRENHAPQQGSSGAPIGR
jgi:choline-sulfatase